jgi:hypothetical protein
MTGAWIKKNLNVIIETKQFEDETFWSLVSNVHDKKKSITSFSTSNASLTSRRQISELSLESISWRAMLRHSFAVEFHKTAQIEFDVIENRGTWEVVNWTVIINKRVKITSLKWVFKYKTNEDKYLLKFKARIVVRDDLQMIDNAQDVYVFTLTNKIFRMLMTFVVAYNLKTRQLDVVNAFLNAKNDEKFFCYMLDDYRLSDKIYRIIRTLYEQRKLSLLWLRFLTVKCLQVGLRSISDESCLFTDENDIIMFFYVNDLIFAYRLDRESAIEE